MGVPIFIIMKGSVQDVFYTVVELFAVAIIVVLCYIVVVNFGNNPQIQKFSGVNETITKTEAAFTGPTDSGFLIVFIMATVSIMILGRLMPTHPVFIVPFIFVVLLLVLFTAQISNWWDEFATNPEISPYISNFVYIPWTMNNLPIITFFIALLTGIIIYSGIPAYRSPLGG